MQNLRESGLLKRGRDLGEICFKWVFSLKASPIPVHALKGSSSLCRKPQCYWTEESDGGLEGFQSSWTAKGGGLEMKAQ